MSSAEAASPAAALKSAWSAVLAGRRADALAIIRRTEAGVEDPPERVLAAAVWNGLGFAEKALPHLEAAVALKPDDAGLQHDLAVVLKALGRAEEAAAACERAIALAPGLARAHLVLSSLRRWTAEDNHIDRLRALSAALPPGLERARAGYALFKELDDLDERGEAFTALTNAADEARAALPWAAKVSDQMPEFLRRAFPRSLMSQPPVAGPARPAPVFIVGLPRSGSTLVELILSAHSEVAALGEVTTLGLALNRAAGVRDAMFYPAPRALAQAGVIDWAGVGRDYRAEAAPFADGARFVIDKLPQNWMLAGAAALAFPDARIVHVRREAMDALFGAYRVLFGGEHRWSYAQDDLARHHRSYAAGMDWWRESLGGRLIEVDYEALVREPDAQIGALLDACGLSREPACFSPHEAAGGVATPSSLQVREPISDRNIGAWRRYERALAPLMAALGDS